MSNEDQNKTHDQHEGCCGNHHDHAHHDGECKHHHDHHDGECGCGEDHEDHVEEEYTVIHLTLDNDEEMDCIVFGTFDFEEKSYIALIPYEEEAQNLLLYEFEELDDGELDLKMIPEEDFDRVADEFDRQFPEE